MAVDSAGSQPDVSGTLNLRSALHPVLEIFAKHHGTVRSMVTLPHENGELHVEASDGLDRPGHTVRYRLGEGTVGKPTKRPSRRCAMGRIYVPTHPGVRASVGGAD